MSITEPLTFDEAQLHQPWTVPYSTGVVCASKDQVPHILASHCCLHAAKSIGKLAAIFESLDHRENPITSEERAIIRDMSADLVTAAIRFANLYGFNLADALEDRVHEKNGVPVREKA